MESGRLEGVIPALERSLAIWRKVEDLDSQGTCLGLLGSAYQRSGDYEHSKPFIAESVRLCVRMDAHIELICALVALHFLSALTAENQDQPRDASRGLGVMLACAQTYTRPS